MNATPLETVLAAIGDYRRSGKSYKARCPAHDDHSPSLSISATEDGSVRLKCWTGCATVAVVTALGLKMRDLFPRVDLDRTPRNSKKSRAPSTAKGNAKVFPSAKAAVACLEKNLGRRTAFWTYTDAGGDPVAVVVRWDTKDDEGKTCKTFRPVSKIDGGWRIGDPPGPWPLYRLPDLLRSTGPVHVVEGEKCADALRALGFTVTTSAHGAKSAKKTDWSPLAGREVVILPDHDDAGARYADDVIELLGHLSPRPSIKIVHLPGLPDGGDAVDFIAERQGGGHE